MATSDERGASNQSAPLLHSGDDENSKQKIAALEVENGLRQFDLALDVIRTSIEPDRPFALRPSLIQLFQSVAVRGIEPYPGQWRRGIVQISKSKHTPPGPHLVETLVQEMCDYVNDNFHEKTAFHLSAYVMWRLNWIHPFTDGNGRTSRVASYVVLSTALKAVLPGAPSVPQQIQEDRTSYFKALEEADAAFSTSGEIDVSAMETVLRNMLAKQLLSIIETADGRSVG